MSATLTITDAPPLDAVQRMVAIASVTPSAVRRAGAPGVAAAARAYLGSLDLRRFAVGSSADCASALERSTNELMRQLPEAGRSWGVARKCLNIFLRDALYSWYLRTHFDLSDVKPWLEAPLDGIVASGLRKYPGGRELPRWLGVKHLTREASTSYQRVAAAAAEQHGVSRVHLDLYLLVPWRP